MIERTSFPKPRILARGSAGSIAYHKTPGRSPGIMFLGGFMSDMTGTKATALEAFAREHGQAFVRFDYRGHGQSSGRFTDGTIGGWAEDATAVLDNVAEGPQVLVGSSMGGWIMLLVALARPERVSALVGIAAAADFTEDLMWEQYPPELRKRLIREGLYRQPSDYADEPYPITLQLIAEGRKHLLLRGPIAIACPVRLLHGMVDADVPWRVSVALAERLTSTDVELILVKDGDHRLSEPADLARLTGVIAALCDRFA